MDAVTQRQSLQLHQCRTNVISSNRPCRTSRTATFWTRYSGTSVNHCRPASTEFSELQ